MDRHLCDSISQDPTVCNPIFFDTDNSNARTDNFKDTSKNFDLDDIPAVKQSFTNMQKATQAYNEALRQAKREAVMRDEARKASANNETDNGDKE